MPEVNVAEGIDWVSPDGLRAQRGGETFDPPAGSWDVNNLVYDDIEISISDHTSDPRGAHIKPDGTRLYVVGRGTVNVVEYHLSTPWLLSSFSYVRQFDLSNQLGTEEQTSRVAHGIYIRADGAFMYIFNRTECWQYELSTPWDVQSAQVAGYFYTGTGVMQRGHDIDFRPDGLMMFTEDREKEEVLRFDLSVAWDIETASLAQVLDISERHLAVRGIELRPDGKRMFLLDTSLEELQQWDLGTAWDITTATFDAAANLGLDNKAGLAFGDEGTVVFTVRRNNRTMRSWTMDV